jgi:phage shock protein C
MIVEIVKKPKIYRGTNGIILGVCNGLEKILGRPAWIFRIIWILLSLFYGAGIVLYFIVGLSLPNESNWEDYQNPKILGVCLNISRHTQVDLSIIRLISATSLFISFGLTILIYIILYFLIPTKEDYIFYRNP